MIPIRSLNAVGGPAFPQKLSDEVNAIGLSARDYFAAKAMQAMVSAEFAMYAVEHHHPGGMCVGERWAQQAYQMADYMLAERAK